MMDTLVKRALSALGAFLFGFNLHAAEPTVGAEELPRFPATPPERALETFKIKPGFRMELAASEPLVMDPVAMSFDENGRLFVVEMRGYSERRPDALGRIRVLEDTDDDGRYDKATVYVDGLRWPTAVLCYDGGVFVGATPEILFCRDTDGDGESDVREVVFTGFADEYAPYETNRLNVQAMLNSFNWGLDNRVHGATSTAGGHVRRPGQAESDAINLRGRDFSFDPKTLELRPENGGGQHGMSFDAAGRKFVCSNSSHCRAVMYDYRYAGMNPDYALPGAVLDIAADGPAAEVYRISPDEPWRVVRTRWRVAGLVRGPVEGGGRPSGYFTAATGITAYRGDAWPEEYRGDLFIADCGSNLIHRKKLRREGVQSVAERPAEERNVEFLASTDNWFRPVQFANAPDGSLYVADMYREIIEHPWSLPASIKQHLDLNSGNDRGRIYRIVPEGFRSSKVPRMKTLPSAQLVALLGHSNGWHRETASRLLYERQDRSVVPALTRLLEKGTSRGRLRALWSLTGLGALTVGHLKSAFRDADADVRRHGVRLLETLQDWKSDKDGPEVWGALRRIARDDSMEVRYQVALTLGALEGSERVPVLEDLCRTGLSDPWMRAAILNSAGPDAGPLLRRLLDDDNSVNGAFIKELAVQTGTSGADVAWLLKRISESDRPRLAGRVISGLETGLRRRGSSLESLGERESLRGIFVRAERIALSPDTDADARADAIRLLGLGRFADVGAALETLIHPKQPVLVQSAALEALSALDDGEVSDLLFRNWSGFTPAMRSQAIGVLLARTSRVKALLNAISSGTISPSELTSTQAAFLQKHKDQGIRGRAAGLLKAPAADRSELIEKYLPATEQTGDMTAGEKLFQSRCASCHRLGGQGFALGPDLVTVRSNGREKILVSLLDPNREVAPNYLSYEVETRDGETLLGLVSDETGNSLVVRQANGLATTVFRSDIVRVKSQGQSVMPEGLEVEMTVRDMADLLEYVMRR